MMYRTYTMIAVVLVLCQIIALTHGTAHAAENKKYASIVVDAETGKVLRARNPDNLLYPASLTKMMTLYMAFDALSRGSLKLNDRIQISSRAANMAPSKIGLAVGSSIKVEDAILALVTKSANDIAVAMGEHLAGSEWAFASKMTAKAKALGMKNSTFKNASGLPDPGQKTTARDMAILARALIYNHPQYYHYFATKNFKYRGVNYGNHNRLMSSYKGMDGIKTGYIQASGFNLVASAVRDNRRLIAVVFGGKSTASRNAHMAEILDEGFSMVKKLPATRMASLTDVPVADVPVSTDIPVPQAKPDTRPPENSASAVIASLAASPSPPQQPQQPQLRAAPLPANNNPRLATNNTKERNVSHVIDDVLGEGDVDPTASARLETGLMAIAAHTGRVTSMSGVGQFGRDTTVKTLQQNPQSWAVQIGAYPTQNISDRAIRIAAQSLPPEIRTLVRPETLPITTGSQVIYRARMRGMDEKTAQRACAYLRNCIVIAP